jgi:hypothetical protein
MVVVALDERNDAAMLGVPPDYGGDDSEQFRRHRNNALAVSLGRRDHQQGDDLSVRALILPDAQVGQLKQFLDANARVAKDFHCGEFPEGGVLGSGDVEPSAASKETTRWPCCRRCSA